MHDTALDNAKRFLDAYVRPGTTRQVVDIGSQDVNGSLRSVCPAGVEYVGVDFCAGPGVDIVLRDPYELPFESESLDVLFTTSCFEHSELFWVLFLELLRVLRPSGLLYLNAPSNGAFHRYPVDCWRFYPDAGRALVTWARRNGMQPALLESFVAAQSDINPWGWNDFVAVFVKDQSCAAAHPRRMLETLPAYSNGVLNGSDGFLRFSRQSEDMHKLRRAGSQPQAGLPED
ncbi:MAG: methyltransferase domain-containing protein [Ramlibacter sp.]